MGNNVIYGLVDPNSNEVRYVGKAIDLYTRIRNHYKPSRLIAKTHKNNWLKTLFIDGLKPLVIILEICESEKELNECEIKWIKYYRELGCDLTNATDGGDGGKLSPESIEKMKKTKSEQKQEPYWKNKKFSLEHCNNISLSKKDIIVSQETKDKLSKVLKGKNTWSKNKPRSIETIEKMRKARIGIARNKKKVLQLNNDGDLIKIWENALDAETTLGLSKGKIRDVCNGKRKTTGGFKWKYKNE